MLKSELEPGLCDLEAIIRHYSATKPTAVYTDYLSKFPDYLFECLDSLSGCLGKLSVYLDYYLVFLHSLPDQSIPPSWLSRLPKLSGWYFVLLDSLSRCSDSRSGFLDSLPCCLGRLTSYLDSLVASLSGCTVFLTTYNKCLGI